MMFLLYRKKPSRSSRRAEAPGSFPSIEGLIRTTKSNMFEPVLPSEHCCRSGENRAFCIYCFPRFSAQKTHLNPLVPLARHQSTTSAWRMS
jgi:hypothetical protein